MKKFTLFLLVMLVCVGLVSCKKITYFDFVENMRVPYDAGTLENGKYNNPIIGIELTAPDSSKYINEVRNYSYSLPTIPSGFESAANSMLSQSLYSEDKEYISVRAIYIKYPNAKKYKSSAELLAKYRDDAIRYATSQYYGERKEKYAVSDIRQENSGNIEYCFLQLIMLKAIPFFSFVYLATMITTC